MPILTLYATGCSRCSSLQNRRRGDHTRGPMGPAVDHSDGLNADLGSNGSRKSRSKMPMISLYRALKSEFDSYLVELRNPANVDLRRRFLKKMDDGVAES